MDFASSPALTKVQHQPQPPPPRQQQQPRPPRPQFLQPAAGIFRSSLGEEYTPHTLRPDALNANAPFHVLPSLLASACSSLCSLL
jgi:hypothetical protein